jgi:hypothetical protein
MTTAREVQALSGRWARDALARVRPWLSGRRAWWIAGTLALVAGAALNWSWLVAIGVAPLLVAALPCVAMCALGLCMNRMMGRSCSKEAAPGEDSAKAQAPIALPPELTNVGPTVSRTTAPAAPAEKAMVGTDTTGRGA